MTEPDWTALGARIDALASTWAVPGGVAVVTDRQGDLYTHSFGFVDVERGIRAEPHHLFEIGSISKLYTAATLLHLVDDGKLRLDQPIGEILTWVPPAIAGARIDHLLQHTAGLVSGIDAVPDQVAQIAGFTGELSEAPAGSWHHYSNLGFILAGLAVEQLTGRPLADLEQQLIFDPLGMGDTTATVTNADYERLARGYRAVGDDRPWLPGDPLRVADWLEVDGADGSIAQTAGDLAVFARMLLARGDGLAEPAVIERMISTLAPSGEETVAITGLEPVTGSRYGLGINVETIA
ncbi:MAG: serine hydrolase domain-containing protein, partial [Pseudolysinimonas sp.]